MKLLLSSLPPFDVGVDLPAGLRDIIDSGFCRVGGCVFFDSLKMNGRGIPDEGFIKSFYGDLSGYESSVNKIHIDNFCDVDILQNSIRFAVRFEKEWDKLIEYPFVAIVSYDGDTEFGPSGTFQFHLRRENEIVFDPAGIESFANPVMMLVG
ncbi:hypothetical protein LBW52_24385 [Ralstonia solanacearum]|uniref:hypothetical protein n=1 Tax=Ralstonia solanacearum TaxID=305 RepID=UPI002306084D|nr:hypothetical protein [Ralstonia solanacearum]MDB0569133.1 hypothetical protein [Ralstonia solanacearum]